MASSHHPSLARTQSVSNGERQQALQSAASTLHRRPPSPPRKRRTRSFSSSEISPPDLPQSVAEPRDAAASATHTVSSIAKSIHPSLLRPPPTPPRPFLSSGDGGGGGDDDDDINHALHELFRSKAKPKSGASLTGILAGMFSCWNLSKSSASDVPASASKHVAVLLEISKKQQLELANKQDTIDMLEWQLQQMQIMEKQMEADAALLSSAEHCAADMATEKHADIAMEKHAGADDKENQTPAGCNTPDRKTRRKESTARKEKAEKLKSEGAEERKDCSKAGRHGYGAAAAAGAPADFADRRAATLTLFEMATVRARFAVRAFGKALIKQLEASAYPVLKTLTELEPATNFARKEHVVYALESRISRAFYHSFENDNFDNSGLLQILDPASRCAARLQEFQRLKLVQVGDAVQSSHPAFDEEFRKFCERKTRELWAQLPWTISFGSGDERDAFTAAFLDAAKGVWLLHRLAFSLHPHVMILRVGKGLQIDPAYVEPLPDLVDGKPCPACLQTKVEFLVVPGFHAMDKVIKCQVYQHIHC